VARFFYLLVRAGGLRLCSCGFNRRIIYSMLSNYDRINIGAIA